eukprot:2738219-Pyramimonas_sp.AAC.1
MGTSSSACNKNQRTQAVAGHQHPGRRAFRGVNYTGMRAESKQQKAAAVRLAGAERSDLVVRFRERGTTRELKRAPMVTRMKSLYA